MSHGNNFNVGTPLMAVYAVAVMEPEQQSTVRSAGSVGADIYEEVVAQGLAGTHLEVAKGIGGSDTRQHVPFTIQLRTTKTTFDDGDVLILTPKHLDIFRGSTFRANIVNIRLSGFENVTCIGFYFMNGCTSLTAIDMRALTTVTSIGSNFMCGCTSLTAIDMSALTNVTSISYSFMTHCTSLTAIDMSPLSNVTGIGSNFMCGCTSLTAIDMSALTNVTSIGAYFATNCTALVDARLCPFTNVRMIGERMFKGCTSLLVTADIKEWMERSDGQQ